MVRSFWSGCGASVAAREDHRNLGGRAGSRPGEEPTGLALRDQRAADAGLASEWRRSRLRYTEISGFTRWAWYAWTETRYAQWLWSVVTFDFGDVTKYWLMASELQWGLGPSVHI